MGDPGKLVLLEAILDVIKRDNLLATVQASGQVLMKGLSELQVEYPQLLNSVRGRGTFIAINAPSSSIRDDMVNRLKKKGIILILLTTKVLLLNSSIFSTSYYNN